MGERLGSAAARAAVLCWLACAAPAAAGEATIGLGIDDLRRDGRTAGAAVEWRGAPLAARGPWAVGIGFAAEADADGDVWAGAGLWLSRALGTLWRIEASVMPGGHARGSGDDLGTGFPIFRSQVGLSRAVGAGWRAGLAFNHKSNARTARRNPGVETLLVTLTRVF